MSSSKETLEHEVIDITNEESIIPAQRNYREVPYWSHKYVYSRNDLNSATDEQKDFYAYYKQRFLAGEFIDLQDNSNYAFILLFDLLHDFDSHGDLPELEVQVNRLGKQFPKTYSYGRTFLLEKMRSVADYDGMERIRSANDEVGYLYDDFWRLGSRYKTKLGLDKQQEKLLNKLYVDSNNFSKIEFCRIQILKLFLAVDRAICELFRQAGTTKENEFHVIGDLIARKQYKYQKGTANYKYALESTERDFTVYIYKHCENVVRERYGHKRKLNLEINAVKHIARDEMQSRIISKLDEVLPNLIHTIEMPDEATDIELNLQNPTRWRITYDLLVETFESDANKFMDSVIQLAQLNKKNTSIDSLYFNAAKFIVKYDKEIALSLYMYYVRTRLRFASSKRKQFTPTMLKVLFKNDDQQQTFDGIVSDLEKTKNLNRALKRISNIYAVTRKKIQLDKSSIKNVQRQHGQTVELLNKYLSEEDEIKNIDSEKITLPLVDADKSGKTLKQRPQAVSPFSPEISLTNLQNEILLLFERSNFEVQQEDIEQLAKDNGLFKNQLIESINESCFEIIDDVLIEEDGDLYTVSPEYYQLILAK